MRRALSTSDGVLAALRAACGRLGDVAGAAAAARHVLALLFVRYVSDVWQHQRDECRRLWGRHPALVTELLRHQRFVVNDARSFHTLHAARLAPGHGARIDAVLRAVEEANLATLRGVFDGVAFDALPFRDDATKDAALRLLLDDIANPALDLRPGNPGASDRAVLAGEFLVAEAETAPDTPAAGEGMPVLLAELLARLLTPRAGEAICDPLCGGASTLAQCAHLLRKHSHAAACELYGQERRPGLRAVGRMNLLLQGLDNHRIETGDVLGSPRLLDAHGRLRRFDVGVAQLPLAPGPWEAAGEDDDHVRFQRGVPPRSRPEYAYILHMVQTLRPRTGRMAVVAPHGVLFRGGAEGRIRQRLLADNLIDAVIGLPPKLLPGSPVPVVVLLLRRARPDDKVLFVDASRDFLAGRRCNRLRVRDVDRIVATVEARRPVQGYAQLVSRDGLRAHGHDLHIPRHLDDPQPGTRPDSHALHGERERLKAELALLQTELDQQLRELGHG